MARFNPRKFTNPDWLGTISPDLLAALLRPWQGHLAQRGFDLPPDTSGCIDCAALAAILMAPDAQAPIAMIDALYYVHEASDAEDVEELQRAARQLGLLIDASPDTSAVDYVIQIWLSDPELIRDRHAEAVARGQQSFDFFAGKQCGAIALPEIDERTRRAIESDFDDWFADHRRGRGCRLLVFRDRRWVWLLVRHGRGMRRELSHADDGTTATQFYRPQQHDVLIYDQTSGEIGVHASTKGERELYLKVLGRTLFGDEGYFPQARKFDLLPLIEQGASSLNCDDIDGIESIRLIEYRQYRGGRHKESEIHRASDVFAAFASRGLQRLPGPTPVCATFIIKFVDSPKERRAVIRVPASARYERNEDSEMVERWLELRGFLTRAPEGREHGDAVVAEVLDSARRASDLGHRWA